MASALDDLEPVPGNALDVPCGTGRIAELLIGRGIPTICGDLSPAMRAETEARLEGQDHLGGVIEIDLEDASDEHAADLVVCFRFLHHLPDAEHRARVLKSLRALTRQTLLLSFHHPISLHNLGRKVKGLLTRRKSDRHTIWPSTLRAEAEAAGLTLVRCSALAAYRRELWLAVLR